MKNRGAILVTLLVVAGLAAALAAVWNQYRQTHRALAFWGTEIVQLIETAATVELVDVASKMKRFDEANRVPEPLDISRAPGLIHFRRSLLEDANFDWAARDAAVADGDWDFAVRFSGNEKTITVLLDLDRRLAANKSSASDTAVLTATTAHGLDRFFQEQLKKGR